MKRNRSSRRVPLRAAALGALLSLAAGGCSSEGRSVQTDRNLITSHELIDTPEHMTLRQVIQRLRPQWLTGRGPTSISTRADPVIVYLNASRIGSDILDQLRSVDARQLQFLDAINATQRFGTGHRSGAILITAK